MIIAKVDPGACGFITTIEAKQVAPGHVYVKIYSDCKFVMDLNIGIVNAYEDLYKSFEDSKVYKRANECIKHVACPIPCAILKAVEAEADLAIPKEITIEFTKIEEEE